MIEKTNIIPVKNISNNSFYYKDQFSEHWTNSEISAYSLDIAIEQWMSKVLRFPLDRIIYASNDFTFRERTRKNEGNLNLPYVSYFKTDYEEVDRQWWNNYANCIGVLDVANEGYENILGTTLKITPIKVVYEATAFFSQHKDCEFAYKELLKEESNETILYPQFNLANGDIVKNIGIQTLELTWNPIYNESDWLESNKIYTIGMDMSYDTFYITGNNTDVHFADEIILDFMTQKTGSDLSLENSKDLFEQYFIQ